MNWTEIKNNKTVEELEEIKSTTEKLIPLLKQYIRTSSSGDKNFKKYSEQLEEAEADLPEVEKAIMFYDFDP